MAEFQHIASCAGIVPTQSEPHPQLPQSFWKDFAEELRNARTPEARAAVIKRYEEAKKAKPSRRQRRGSTLDPVQFRPLDRNQRARLIFLCERLDAQTKEKGKHGGCLKRTALQVMRVLLFHYHNVATGRCDPSYDTIAQAAGMSRSAVAEALNRLEAAGIITRIRRARWVRRNGRKCCVQWTNAYLFDLPHRFRQSEAAWYTPTKPSKSDKPAGTTAEDKESMPPMPECVAAALDRLGKAMAERAEMENRQMKDGMTPA